MSIMIGITEFLSPFDMIGQFYLLAFGLIMVIIDIPFENDRIKDFKLAIYKYLLFMTRFVGRGVWYLFLSTMVWVTLYGQDLEPFVGFLLSGIIFAVGLCSIYTGLQKTIKLNNLRMILVKKGADEVTRLAPPEATSYSEGGWHYNQWNEFSRDQTRDLPRRIEWTEEEFKFVAAALSFKVKSDGIIDRTEFLTWTTGSLTIL